MLECDMEQSYLTLEEDYDVVACQEHALRNVLANKTACACDEDVHTVSFVLAI